MDEGVSCHACILLVDLSACGSWAWWTGRKRSDQEFPFSSTSRYFTHLIHILSTIPFHGRSQGLFSWLKLGMHGDHAIRGKLHTVIQTEILQWKHDCGTRQPANPNSGALIHNWQSNLGQPPSLWTSCDNIEKNHDMINQKAFFVRFTPTLDILNITVISKPKEVEKNELEYRVLVKIPRGRILRRLVCITWFLKTASGTVKLPPPLTFNSAS